MLKIKDNVDLKKLEKFGFEYTTTAKYFDYINKDVNIRVGNWDYIREFGIKNRILSGYGDFDIAQLDILYDLIKADLVEKVSDGNE